MQGHSRLSQKCRLFFQMNSPLPFGFSDMRGGDPIHGQDIYLADHHQYRSRIDLVHLTIPQHGQQSQDGQSYGDCQEVIHRCTSSVLAISEAGGRNNRTCRSIGGETSTANHLTKNGVTAAPLCGGAGTAISNFNQAACRKKIEPLTVEHFSW